MRIKLGPYKVTPEFWQRLQGLPGQNDEQRVMLALDFAMNHIDAQIAARVQMDAKIAQVVDAERVKKAVEDAAVHGEGIIGVGKVEANFESGPMVHCRFNEDGSLREATPEEIAADAEAAKTAPKAVITAVDHEAKTITIEGSTP